MNRNDLKEAVEEVKDNVLYEGDAIQILVDLAEQVLAWEGQMPKKKDPTKYESKYSCSEALGYNAAIDSCITAIVRALPSMDEIAIEFLIACRGCGRETAVTLWTGKHYKMEHKEFAEIAATTIHALILDKLKGEKS